MSMINTGDILETIEMFTQENLDVRTVTMGISLLDCIDPDPDKACEKIYNKITTKAKNLVSAVEGISDEYGIPIVNKRISVTPIAMLLGACPDADPVQFAKTLDRAGKAVGVNFIGGYTALVHKGFSAGDLRLIESIPRALAETDIVCSSVNIGATKAGLNMDAIKLMGEAVKKSARLTADRQCIGAAKLVVFCNAPGGQPIYGRCLPRPGEPDCEIHVGVSGPGAVRAALAKLPKDAPIDRVAELVKKTAFKITRIGQLVANLASEALGVPAGIIDLSLAPTPAKGDSVANILEEMGLETCGCCGTTACLALLNDAVKKGGVMASNHVGGLSGAFIPVSEDDGMIHAARNRLPYNRKIRGNDGCLQCGYRYGYNPGGYLSQRYFCPYCRRSRNRYGKQQNHCGKGYSCHRQKSRRNFGLRRSFGIRPNYAYKPNRSVCVYKPRRKIACAYAVT